MPAFRRLRAPARRSRAGLTHVIDKVIDPRGMEDVFDTPATTSTSSSWAGARRTSRTNLERKFALLATAGRIGGT